MKIYVCGPMTGWPNNNQSRFSTAKAILEKFYPQHEFINPHDLEVNLRKPEGSTTDIYRAVLPADVAAICECGAIILLPGFEQSLGASFEQHLAELIDAPILRPAYDTDEWVDTPRTLYDWLHDAMVALEVAA